MKIGTLIRRSRRWADYPQLLLPITRGPLLGFYHFLTGYFVPVYRHLMDHPAGKFALIDCGPMNKWFEILPRQPFRILDAVEALQTGYRSRHSGFARRYRVRSFVDWDVYRYFPSRPIKAVAQDIALRFPPKKELPSGSLPSLVAFSRVHSDEALLNHPYRRFGTAKRDIPNLTEATESMASSFAVTVVDGARLHPMDVIEACQSAQILLGQHGAGLANALFASSSAHIAEVGWEDQDSLSLGHYRALSEALDLPWHYLQLQAHQFSRIDASELQARLRGIVQAQSGRESGLPPGY